MAVKSVTGGSKAVEDAQEGLVELTIPVRGMSCQSCVRHVRGALEGTGGVMHVLVDLDLARAEVTIDPTRTSFPVIQEAIEAVGYVADDPIPRRDGPATSEEEAVRGIASRASLRRPVILGVAGSLLLAAFYMGVVTLAQGFQHTVDLFLEDWYLVEPIVLGFGIQVGLFVHLRGIARRRGETRSATALAGASTGTSTVGMIACCAHHAADLLPLIGLSGAAVFLADYRVPLMVTGIATNTVAIGVMVRRIRRMSHGA